MQKKSRCIKELPQQHVQMDVIIHILSFLSDNHKAAVAKLVCKEAYREFRQHSNINIAACCELPEACLLDFLQQHTADTDLQECLMHFVAEQGDLPRLQLLHAHGCAWEEYLCVRAAKAGHLPALQWLATHHPPCDWDPCTCAAVARKAAGGAHLEILQWTWAQDVVGLDDAGVCEAAAEHGHLHVLQWLRAQDPPCSWNQWTCTYAARNGHLAVLQWARGQEPACPWDKHLCIQAAGKGHLGILQWALAQDPPAPWDPYACCMAACRGHLHVLQWVAGQEPSLPWSWQDCMDEIDELYGGGLPDSSDVLRVHEWLLLDYAQVLLNEADSE